MDLPEGLWLEPDLIPGRIAGSSGARSVRAGYGEYMARNSPSAPAQLALAALHARHCLLAAVALLGASSCLFGGSKDDEEKIDPNEATAREAVYRTDAEIARDNRFSDRMQRRPRLDAPAGPNKNE